MASTYNLQSTVAWASPFMRFTPQGSGSLEPALSSANLIKQTILGPPFRWRQNRGYASFQTSATVQDYAVSLGDFGFLEKATMTDAGGNTFELGDQEVLSLDAESGRPVNIASQLDDNAGHITFRLQPSPDQGYTATLIYQRKAVPMSSLVSLWAPLPDELAYIYNWGFLAMSAMLNNDARSATFNQKFVGHLLGAQDGISDLARNIFLNNWLQVQAQAQRSAQVTQQGVTARTI